MQQQQQQYNQQQYNQQQYDQQQYDQQQYDQQQYDQQQQRAQPPPQQYPAAGRRPPPQPAETWPPPPQRQPSDPQAAMMQHLRRGDGAGMQPSPSRTPEQQQPPPGYGRQQPAAATMRPAPGAPPGTTSNPMAAAGAKAPGAVINDGDDSDSDGEGDEDALTKCTKCVDNLFIKHPWLTFGGFIFVLGVVLGSIGGACLEDTLIGVDDCNRTIGAVFIIIGAPMATIVTVVVVGNYVRNDPGVPKEWGLVYFSLVVVLIGAAIGIFGLTCLNNSIGTNCAADYGAAGAISMIVGWSMVVGITILVTYLLFPHKRPWVHLFTGGSLSFSVQCIGGACIDNNISGVDQCDRLLGVVLVTIGSGFMAFVLIIALALYLDKWQAHKGLVVMTSVIGITGVALGSLGWSCLVNTLVGAGDPVMGLVPHGWAADDSLGPWPAGNATVMAEIGRTHCDLAAGTVLASIGWAMASLVWFCLLVIMLHKRGWQLTAALVGTGGLYVGAIGVACEFSPHAKNRLALPPVRYLVSLSVLLLLISPPALTRSHPTLVSQASRMTSPG